MLNRIVIMGRLTRDPELRRTQNGTAVTSFSVAVDRDFKSRESGEKATDFIDVVAWRQTAEFVCQYFTDPRLERQGWQQPPQRGSGCRQHLFRRQQARQPVGRRLRAPRLRLSRRELYRSCERRLCRN